MSFLQCEDALNLLDVIEVVSGEHPHNMLHRQPLPLLPREILSDGAGNGHHEPFSPRGFDDAHDPQHQGEKSEQSEQRYPDPEAAPRCEVSVASEHPAHSKKNAQYDTNDVQAAKGHNGLRSMKTHIRPLVDEKKDDAGEPAQHIAQGRRYILRHAGSRTGRGRLV